MKFVTQDYYEILNVSPGASNEEVKRAYRLVRQSFRPDSMAIHSLYAPEETEAISAKIDEAFRILSDAELARRYAKYHRSAGPGSEVPRDPDVFFDLVHDLDGPSPIEQLARQVGRLSVVRSREDRVVENPVSVGLASIPPEPRYHPSPVSSTALPAVSASLPQVQAVLGDAMEVETDPQHHAISLPVEPAYQAPPASIFDEPVSARASVLIDIDSKDEDDIEPLSILAQVSLEEDDDDAIISFDDDDPVSGPVSGPVESLPSSAFLSPLEPGLQAAPTRPPAELTPSPRPVAEPARPAAFAQPDDPSLRPLPGAQVHDPVKAVQAHTPQLSMPLPPAARPAPAPQAQPVAARTTPSAQPVIAATTPSVTPVQPLQPTTVPSQPPVTGALALNRRVASPRRWDRASIRTRAVGPLDVPVLSRDVMESMIMDCGGMNGAFLQTARRELGVAIKDISGRTKISVMMLRYIEADDVSELPAKVYLKGYLTQIARLLKLPAQEFVQGYMKANGIP